MRRPALALIFSSLCWAIAGDDVDESRRIYQDALAAYEKHDHATYLVKVRAASDLRPHHPALLTRHAAALALNAQHEAALAMLERVASMGFVEDIAASPDFESVRLTPRFQSIVKRFEANARRVGQAREEFTIDRLGLIPEGMAHDRRANRWFVSSVRSRTIFAVDAKGAVSVLTNDLPWGVFGMVHDATRGVLWATTSAMPQVEGFRVADEGKSALLKVDPQSGRVLETLRATDDARHHFNDVALANDGTVYVSDGASPAIFRVRGKVLEPFARGPFSSLQGLAVSGATLYAADYAKGIFAVDRRTLDVRLLTVPSNASVLGVDGLYLVSSQTLVATQNGTRPNRIVRIRLAPGGLGISAVETLLANAPGLGDPTLGVVVDNRFYFNANGQWDQFAEDGTIRDPVALAEAVVLSIALR